MTISPGFTAAEVREFVHEYQLLPYGQKGPWLPYVSDDNPFSEAGFRTMKYRPGYPKVFADLDSAREYIAGYVPWYNDEHKHSGIALFSPSQVHDGTWRQVWEIREAALQRYFQAHPERFRARPSTPTPAGTVGINLPDEKPQNKAA